MNDENVAPSSRFTGNTRRMNKPLMERRRRQRINNCLDELKAILETLSKNETSYLSKLEKADILELTVQCIRNLKRRQPEGDQPATNRPNAESYALGYDSCVAEVIRCLRARNLDNESGGGVQPAIMTGLLDHLAKRRGQIAPAAVRCDDDSISGPMMNFAPSVNHQKTFTNADTRIDRNDSFPFRDLQAQYRDPINHGEAAELLTNLVLPSSSSADAATPASSPPMIPVSSSSSGPTTSSAAAPKDCSRRPLPTQTMQFLSEDQSAPLSAFTGNRLKCGDQSTYIVRHDSDRLRRQICRGPERTAIPVASCSVSDEAKRHQLPIVSAASFVAASSPMLSVERGTGLNSVKQATLTFDCSSSASSSSSMWRPW